MKNIEFIMGKNTIEEVLRHRKDILKKVFILDTTKEKGKLESLLKDSNIDIEYVNKKRLSSFVNSDSHQGIVAKIRNRNFLSIEDVFKKTRKKKRSIILALDDILDPHNFGAILRTAECFQVDGVIFSKNRSPGITPVVSKTSSGASELVDLCMVSNLSENLKKFKKEDFFIISADSSKEAKSLKDFSFPEKCVIIMGAEGKGIRNINKKLSDDIVKINMMGKIDSLNVSQATAVFLFASQI